jgi:hypothetical protein
MLNMSSEWRPTENELNVTDKVARRGLAWNQSPNDLAQERATRFPVWESECRVRDGEFVFSILNNILAPASTGQYRLYSLRNDCSAN